MGSPRAPTNIPHRASTVRSVVTALLSIVVLPTTPLSSTLDILLELVGEIVEISRASRRQIIMNFGEHVRKVVNHLVSALRDEQFSRQPNVRKNLEELHRTLDKILDNLDEINSSRSLLSRLGRTFFPEEDHTQVTRMRQQLDDALSLFQLIATCEILARTENIRYDKTATNGLLSIQHQNTRNVSSTTINDISQAHECANIRPEPDQVHRQSSRRPDQPSRSLRLATGHRTKGELADAGREVDRLHHLFQESRSPTPAMQLAAALGRYSDLLIKSGHAAEALAASQESAQLFKALAERGPEIYF
ncbi:unnamed protein product [Rhizoctonia solani]|uniref:Uncharacterized protein n=1 Tax=Rhizoctonia solani TaxID=456999 RepID=A0A8H3GXY8_9AGAM|nr:unnamed protein product [Rhizoctonia solani]CAE7225938.1 unnamed protein product [Rhizoctonia solani]